MEFSLFLRILRSFVIFSAQCVPGGLGFFLLTTGLKDENSLNISAGVLLIAISILWVCVRFKELISLTKATLQANEALIESLQRDPAIAVAPGQNRYFRRPWTYSFFFMMFIPLLSIFSFDYFPELIPVKSFLCIFILSLTYDLFTFQTSILIWYGQKDKILTRYFTFLPLQKFDLTSAKAYLWSTHSPVYGRKLVLYDKDLKHVFTLPLEDYNFRDLEVLLLRRLKEIPRELIF